MKCFTCKNEIKDESKMKLISHDGDFVCNSICEKRYEKEKEEFFDKIHSDEWYNNYLTGSNEA